MEPAASLGHPHRHDTVPDFGCGAARLTRAQADAFDRCVGVGISAQMIEQARSL